MLDLLELYTHHRTSTSIGADFPLDAFLNVRIPLNKEADGKKLPRYAFWKKDNRPARNGAAQVPNGVKDSRHGGKAAPQQQQQQQQTPQPVNPLTPSAAHKPDTRLTDRGRDSTVRFMLDPEQAAAERGTVTAYFKVEMEEYEVEE